MENVPLSLLAAAALSGFVSLILLFFFLRFIIYIFKILSDKENNFEASLNRITLLIALLFASIISPITIYFIFSVYAQTFSLAYILFANLIDCAFAQTMIAAGCENGGVIINLAWQRTLGSIDRSMPDGMRIFDTDFIRNSALFVIITVALVISMRWWIASNKSDEESSSRFGFKVGTFSNIFFGLIFLLGFYFTFSALLSHSLLRNNSTPDDQMVVGVAQPILDLVDKSFNTNSNINLDFENSLDGTMIANRLQQVIFETLDPKQNKNNDTATKNTAGQYFQYTSEQFQDFRKSNSNLLQETIDKIENFKDNLSNLEKIYQETLNEYKAITKENIKTDINFIKSTLTGRAEKINYLSDVRRWIESTKIREMINRLECVKRRSPVVDEIDKNLLTALKANVNSFFERVFTLNNQNETADVNFMFKQYFSFFDSTLSDRVQELQKEYNIERASSYCSVSRYIQDIGLPSHPVRGSNLGPLAPFVMWLLSSEAKEPVIIIGLLGVSLVGASLGRVYQKNKEGTLIIKNNGDGSFALQNISLSFTDSFIVICYGVAASIIMFLAAYGGLSILQEGAVQGDPDTYLLFAVCLVSAMFSEDVWKWARGRFNPSRFDINHAQTTLGRSDGPPPDGAPPTSS